MNDENFLAAIRDNPDDEASRLVYADWLEERGDCRAKYLRQEHRLAQLSRGSADYETLEILLFNLASRGRIEWNWLNTVTRVPLPEFLRYPDLSELLGAWFHQDWVHESGPTW